MKNNTEQLTVATLIKLLNKVEDKTLPIRVHSDNSTDKDNQWVDGVELHNTGKSGYEVKNKRIKENIMKQATAPDTRPAIAFDTGTEVKTIMDALRAYRVYEVTDEENKEYIRKIEDQFELVLKMFLKK